MQTRTTSDSNKYIQQIITNSDDLISPIFVIYKDNSSEVIQVPNNEIRQFILHAESHALIDTDLANSVKKDYPHLFSPPATIRQLTTLYTKMQTLVIQALNNAEKEGKQLLILAGEGHYNEGSLILQTMLLYIISQVKINTVLAEASPTMLHKLINKPREIKKINAEYSIPLAHHELKMNIIAADLENDSPYHVSHNEISSREAFMASKCLEVKDNCCFIMGSTHLKNIINEKSLNEKYHILGLNIRCMSEKELTAVVARKSTQEEKECFTFPSSAKTVAQINLEGSISGTREEIVSSARSLHYSQSLSLLDSILKKSPDNIAARLARANINTNRKAYSKALEDYTYVKIREPKHQQALDGIITCNKYLSTDDEKKNNLHSLLTTSTSSTTLVANSLNINLQTTPASIPVSSHSQLSNNDNNTSQGEEKTQDIIAKWVNTFDKNNGNMTILDLNDPDGTINLLMSILNNDSLFKNLLNAGHGKKAKNILEEYAKMLCSNQAARENPNSSFRNSKLGNKIYVWIKQIDNAINSEMNQHDLHRVVATLSGPSKMIPS